MASFVERISVIIDTKTDQAITGFKAFRSEVAAADGIGGKFKAGWKNVTSQLGQNIATFAATAGAALFAFGLKALKAFEDTAKAALDLGKATGLSTEQASRWIAVADDYAVTADALQSALQKMGKSLDSGAFEKYGIATKDAAGNARSTNAVFLDVLETLNNTKPAARARVGAELLGKSWGGVAPLLGKTRAEYEKMLGAVEKGQVITSAEAKKAERMRLAQDALKDALGEVTLAVGEQVAELGPLVELLAKAATASTSLTPSFGDLSFEVTEIAEAAIESGDAIQYLIDKGYSANTAAVIMQKYADDTKEAREQSEQMASTAADQADKMDTLTRAIEQTTTAVDALQDSYEEFMGTIDDEEAYQNVALDLLDLEKTLADIDASVKDGSMTWEEGARRASVAISGNKKAVADYAREVLGVPPERLTNIFALIDQGKLTEAQTAIDNLVRSRTIEVLVNASPKGGGSPGSGGGADTRVPQNGKGGGSIGATSTESAGVRGGMTVNFYGVTNAREIVDLITAAEKDGVRAGWMVQR